MSKIKTREVVNSVKKIDKSQIASERMKSAFVRSKEQINENHDFREETQNEYAGNRTEEAVETGVYKSADIVSDSNSIVTHKAKDLYTRNREIRGIKEELKQNRQPQNPIPNNPPKPVKKATPKTRSGNNKYVKTLSKPQKNIRQSNKTTHANIKRSGKYTIKRSKKTIKSTHSGSKVAIKTSKQAVKTTKSTMQASQRAYQMAKITARATVKAIQVAVKATIAAVKAIIVSAKALIAAIAAGGWVAVLIIVLICIIGMIVGSCFGIFFSGEDTGTSETMQSAVTEINTDYQAEIDRIKSSNTYDNVEMSGSKTSWSDVLSIYAVATTTDSENATDVATMDDERKAILEDVFWDMNDISHYTNTRTYTEIIVTDDGEGNLVEEEVEVTKKTLYITVTHKTTDEMASEYSFTDDEYEMLEELLSDEYSSMWSQVLYGINSSSEDIVAVALSQLGNIGGEPYWSWYGFSSRAEWCACFVSWCANECGYIEAGIIPKFAACTSQGMPWFQERGGWQDRYYEPQAGDIIFFDWDNSGNADHVGIVEKCENGIVYTIEGNSGDMCKQKQYSVGSSVIRGYGIPAY